MLHTMLIGLALAPAFQKPALAPNPPDVEAGCLQIVDKDGKMLGLCPLEGTKVEAEIAGFGARVTVKQTFSNPSKTPIEAVYTFPLPADAAVDRMNMRLGDRLVLGEIKRREEARRVYEAAKNAGQAAALLDQERPNLFTQSLANVMPGTKVEIEISYVQLLKFEEDRFEFSYPMVVGPRFLGNAPDPGKIAPPITPKGTRTGATIDLRVRIDAGAPITSVDSELHEVKIQGKGSSTATVTLAKKDEIPNRDFILRYGVASNTVQSALLTYADAKNGGFFTLILMPPKAPTPDQIAPREVIFVVDQSGSQSGFPIEKSKELTRKMIAALRHGDTFNVMGFANNVAPLWGEPRPANDANRAEALRYLAGLQANGGTQLFHAVNAALQPKPDPKRVRLVLFNTDGFIGDEFNVLAAIQKYRGTARMFTFGIGNSVNRFLIDAMSLEGRGDSEIVTLAAETDAAVARFVRRTQTPVLTQIEAKFEGVAVADVLPAAIPDVYSEKPVILKGRYTSPGKGKIVLTGILGDTPWRKEVPLNLPDGPMVQNLIEDLRGEGLQASQDPEVTRTEPANLQAAFGSRGSAIATLWAREMIDDVMRSNWMAMSRNAPADPRIDRNKQTENAVTQLGLRFGLMTQYTSFVAVERRVVNLGGKQITVAVPVEMADGVSYEGAGVTRDANVSFAKRTMALGASGGPGGGRSGGGFGGGGVGGGGGALPPPGAIRPGITSPAGAAGVPASSLPVRRLKIRSSDPDYIKLMLAGTTRLTFDPADGKFFVPEPGGGKKKGFDELSDREVEALYVGLNDTLEVQMLKTLTPDQTLRYHLITKVDASLRESKEATLAVQVWVVEWKADHETPLKEAGLKELQPSAALKVAFGSCDRASLGKLAALPFVKRIVPIGG